MTRERQGVLLCLTAAAGFGAMAVFAKLAYREGANVQTVLAVRFALASLALWALAALTRSGRATRPRAPAGRTLTPRLAGAGLLLGLVFYSAQSGLFFSSLTRIDASTASLALYTFPAMVVVAAFLLGRERPTARRAGALALASGGVVLVLLGGGTGAVDPLGAGLALGAAVSYTTYILVSDSLVRRIDPLLLPALITTGATIAFGGFALATGRLELGLPTGAWAAIGGLALFSTVVPIGAFLAGLARVGPSRASILSTAEPVVTVVLAGLVLGERLGPAQVAGGVLVLAAVVLLQARSRGRARGGALAPAEA